MALPALRVYGSRIFALTESIRFKSHEAQNILNIVAVEAFATVRHIIPSTIIWIIKKFKGDFTKYSLSHTVEKISICAEIYGYKLEDIKAGDVCRPLLFMHGDHSSPPPYLGLVNAAHKIAEKSKKQSSSDHPKVKQPIFLVHMPSIHRDDLFDAHALLTDAVIKKIKELVGKQDGIFDGILGVGHSKGAMQLVERQFNSDLPSDIIQTFSIAGPVRVTQEATNFMPPLSTIFNGVYPKILQHTDRKIIQIVPKDDWNAPGETMAVRPHEFCYSVNGMHLSALFESETVALFKKFIKGELEIATNIRIDPLTHNLEASTL